MYTKAPANLLLLAAGSKCDWKNKFAGYDFRIISIGYFRCYLQRTYEND